MKEALKLSLALGIICGVAASVLAFAEWQTQEPRKRAETAQRQEALRLVLPEFANDPLAESTTIDGVVFYPARNAEGEMVGVAGEGSSSQGFGGTVTVLVSFGKNRNVRCVIVTDHKETPGLGTQVTDRRRERSIWEAFTPSRNDDRAAALPPNRFLDAFQDKPAHLVASPDFQVVKNKEEAGQKSVLAVSGATVSSRAVEDAIATVCAAAVQYRPGARKQTRHQAAGR